VLCSPPPTIELKINALYSNHPVVIFEGTDGIEFFRIRHSCMDEETNCGSLAGLAIIKHLLFIGIYDVLEGVVPRGVRFIFILRS
jgi:hypothetical protein